MALLCALLAALSLRSQSLISTAPGPKLQFLTARRSHMRASFCIKIWTKGFISAAVDKGAYRLGILIGTIHPLRNQKMTSSSKHLPVSAQHWSQDTSHASATCILPALREDFAVICLRSASKRTICRHDVSSSRCFPHQSSKDWWTGPSL
jgi:hypothetical protein